MNNINSTFTSVFLDALAKDKSTVKTMSPIVVFRRVLGLGERVDTREVMKSLQRHATLMGKLKEFSSNVISNKFTGEVISFDIGPDPAWTQFKVIREPVPEGKGTVINFIFVVTDQKNLKRWTRLVGTIANELKDGKNVPVFRLIQDMCIEEDLPKPVKEEDLEPLNKEVPSMPEPGDIQEPVKEPDPPKNVVFRKGDIVDVNVENGTVRVSVRDVDGKQKDVWVMQDPEGTVQVSGLFSVAEDVLECSEESMLSTFLEKFFLHQMKDYSKEEPQDEEPAPPSPSEEVEIKKILHTGTRVKFDICDEGVVRILSVPEEDGEDHAVLHEFTDYEFENYVNPEKTYIVVHDLWSDSFDDPASEIALAFKEEVLKTSDAEPDEEKPAAVVADIDQKAEIKEPVVVIKKGEIVTLEEYPGKEFVSLDKDLTDVEVSEATKNGTLFDLLSEVKKEEAVGQVQVSVTKGNIMEEIVIYNEGDEAEFPQAPDKRFKANRKITQQMVTDHKGIMPTEWFDEIVAEVPAEEPQTTMKPIGEEPNTKKCSEEHTQSEYMNMLFGTPNPSILHVVNMLKKCAGGDEYDLTGTDTIERMIAYSDYTFSIVKMKNGAYYRVWVAHTDMDRGLEGSWLNTHAEPDRWFKLGDIQDREMSRLLNSRR